MNRSTLLLPTLSALADPKNAKNKNNVRKRSQGRSNKNLKDNVNQD